MKIMFSETIGQMVDLLHEGSSQVSVSKCLLQLCSGEDFQPRHRVAHEYTACIVGDGHSGNGCTSIIDQNAEANLSAVIQSKDLGIGMNTIMSIFYSIQQSFNLAKNSGIEYDLVIRYRFDLQFTDYVSPECLFLKDLTQIIFFST